MPSTKLKISVLSLGVLCVPAFKANQYYNRNFKYPQNIIHSNWFTQDENTTSNCNKKNVIVIGAGVNGLCNAYQLSKLSKQNEYINKVAIIDKNSQVADECTKAAAGIMGRSYSSLDKRLMTSIISNFTTHAVINAKSLFSSKTSNNNNNKNGSSLKQFQFFQVQWSNVIFNIHFWQWGMSFLYKGLMRSSLFGKKINSNNNNNQLDMRSFMFHSVDYFIDFIKNNCENIDVVNIANNMNVRNNDSSDDVTLSQLCGYSNVGAAKIIRNGKQVARIIKDKKYVEFGNSNSNSNGNEIIINDENFGNRQDILHLCDDIIVNSKDGEFIKIYYGYSQGEPAQLIDLSHPLISIETKTQILSAVDLGLQNTPNINEIKGLEHTFNVSVADGHNFSLILGNYLSDKSTHAQSAKSNNSTHGGTTTGTNDGGNVDFWNDTQILDIEYCNDENNKSHVSRLYTNQGIIEIPENTIVVVSAGSWTPLLLRKIGVFVPVYPIKGYDIILEYKTKEQQEQEQEGREGQEGQASGNMIDWLLSDKIVELDKDIIPNKIIVEGSIYLTPAGRNRVRISGVGEFDGWNTKANKKVEKEYRSTVAQLFPQFSEYLLDSNICPIVCGLRPLTSDASVIISKIDSKFTNFNLFKKRKCFDNLYVNVGPGQNGWKGAMGQGRVLATLIANDIQQQLSTQENESDSIVQNENRQWLAQAKLDVAFP